MPEETTDQQEQAQADEQANDEDAANFEFTAEDTGKLKKSITVTVPRERIDAKLDEMFGELSTTSQVPMISENTGTSFR